MTCWTPEIFFFNLFIFFFFYFFRGGGGGGVTLRFKCQKENLEHNTLLSQAGIFQDALLRIKLLMLIGIKTCVPHPLMLSGLACKNHSCTPIYIRVMLTACMNTL